MHKATQQKQIEQWRQLIIDWSRSSGQSVISVSDCEIFENKKINRELRSLETRLQRGSFLRSLSSGTLQADARKAIVKSMLASGRKRCFFSL